MRTTDLARLDADGFLWILGRADQTILRGGYKIQPDVVRAALERDPAVRGGRASSGVRDARLGAVPVAAVERRPGARSSTRRTCWRSASRHLAPYELPVAITVVDELAAHRRRARSTSPRCAALFDGDGRHVGP